MGELFINIVRFSSGERLPLLFDRNRGVPLFEPTVYVLTQVRARNRSSATIERELQAILVLELTLEICKIDLEARFQEGKVFTIGEIDELVRLSRLCVENLRLLAKKATSQPKLNISSLESHRLRVGKAALEVSPKTSANRIRGIRDYLHWLVSLRLGKLNSRSEMYRLLVTAGEQATSALASRIEGIGDDRAVLFLREGLEQNEIAELLRVIMPGALDNPWRGRFVQQRNFLMVHWLYALGLRRGELLNIKVSDIDFRKQEVIVARRADDPEDPRLNQPKTKTRDRILVLGKEICEIAYVYVMTARRAIPGARRHEFLLVSDRTGAPLSLSALNRTFEVLRERCPSLPETLSPHVLRHSWNDSFSELMDRKGIAQPEEHKMRSFLMGWSETSNTAQTYTRRHTRKQANNASLEMQEAVTKGHVDE